MKMKFCKAVSMLCGALMICQSVNAANIGVCTHMTAKHTGETPERITELVKEVGAEWVRDELRWGWGMQTEPNGEMKMPSKGMPVTSEICLRYGFRTFSL